MQDTLRRLICVECLFATLIVPGLSFVPGLSSLRGQDSLSEPARPETSLAARVRPVIEAVMEHHIDPPTRQQLVLEILRGAAESGGQRSPGDLSPRISDAVDADALYNLLAVELERQGLNKQPSDEMIATVFERLSAVVPGGVQIVSQKDHNVNEQLAANRYVGIGVQVSLDETTNRLKIQKAMEGGTAAAHGILDNDVVESVDGSDTLNVPLEEVVQWLRGPEDSVVRMSVRSPGAGAARELEVVRRVVPIRTVQLVPQSHNDSAALIRFDRFSASNVHEIRKIVGEMPASVNTLIFDLRFPWEGSLHHVHLMADAFLEECHIGDVESRSGVRPLKSEAGTVIGDRRAALVYSPGYSHQVDWLAAVAAENEIRVYIDDSNPRHEMSDHSVAPEAITEFVPVSGGTHYVGLAMSRLLTVDGKLPDRAKPAGTVIVPDSSATTLALEWLSNLGSAERDSTVTVPLAIEHRKQALTYRIQAITARTETARANLLQLRHQATKPPASNEILIERIMADLPED